MAKSKGFSRIVVESGSKLVIESICGAYNTPWRLKVILEDIHRLAGFFENICWKYVFKEANFLMDAITSVGFSVADFRVWDRTG